MLGGQLTSCGGKITGVCWYNPTGNANPTGVTPLSTGRLLSTNCADNDAGDAVLRHSTSVVEVGATGRVVATAWSGGEEQLQSADAGAVARVAADAGAPVEAATREFPARFIAATERSTSCLLQAATLVVATSSWFGGGIGEGVCRAGSGTVSAEEEEEV